MIYGIIGSIGSGKDTVARILVEEYSYQKISFADTLKDVLSVIFGWERYRLDGLTREDRIWRETPDLWWSQKLGIVDFSPRKAMQTIGTDLFRDHFSDNIWICSLMCKIKSGNVVVPDVRFQNEFDAIKNQGGEIIHVIGRNERSMHETHKSENGLLQYTSDHVIENNSTIEILTQQIKKLLEDK
jgi:hypothetical protein